jgi:hypothetical protein
VTFAIDRKEILDKVEFGEGIVAHGPLSPPMGVLYDPEFEKGRNGQYYDPEQAKAWMKQARYDGREVLFLSVNTQTAPRRAEMIQAQLAKIGIKVRIELADFPSFRRRWLQERQWDTVSLQWDADLDPDETIYPELRSGETWNVGKWVNDDPPPRQREQDLPQAREGLPDDPGRPHQHARGLAGQALRAVAPVDRGGAAVRRRRSRRARVAAALDRSPRSSSLLARVCRPVRGPRGRRRCAWHSPR